MCKCRHSGLPHPFYLLSASFQLSLLFPALSSQALRRHFCFDYSSFTSPLSVCSLSRIAADARGRGQLSHFSMSRTQAGNREG